jgi:uncharacterized protein YvpB
MTSSTSHRLWLAILAIMAAARNLPADPLTGRQFFPFAHFDQFEIETFASGGIRLTSPIIEAGFDFNQLVVSWNIALGDGACLKVDALPVFDGRTGSFYTLGYWSGKDASATNRRVPFSRSVRASNSDGEVQTDILVLSRPAQAFRVRLSIALASYGDPTVLKFIGISVLNSAIPPPDRAVALAPTRGLALPVPTRSQLDYAGGAAWCSPTSLSMVLNYWAARLNRPDLDRDVPEVAAGVDDPGWPGTGNWSFNTAYAGSFAGMRGYVTRLGDVGELELWINAGVPVVASVAYSLLKGEPSQNDGHLVVVVGFDPEGAVILNDPGTRHSVRKTVPRAQFATAWSHSRNTVYLVYPVDHPVPASPDGHW